MSDRLFLGNLKMNPGLEKWTVFWSETFRVEPDLVNWTDFSWNFQSAVSVGRQRVFPFEKFHMETGLVNWTYFLNGYSNRQ